MHRMVAFAGIAGLGLLGLTGCQPSQATYSNGVLTPNEATPIVWTGEIHPGSSRLGEDGEVQMANDFVASADVGEVIAVKQRDDVWCWAACAEMVHRYYGSTVTQEAIVTEIKGTDESDPTKPVEEAASKREMMLALNPELKDYFATIGTAKAIEIALQREIARGEFDASPLINARFKYERNNSDLLVDALLDGDPAILVMTWPPEAMDEGAAEFALAHAFVLEKINYQHIDTNPHANALQEFLWKIGIGNATSTLEGSGTENYFNPNNLEYPDRASFYAIKEIGVVDPWDATRTTYTGEYLQDNIVYFFTKEGSREILLLEAKMLNLELPPEYMEEMEKLLPPAKQPTPQSDSEA